MNNIIDLQETSPDHWRAKYQGSKVSIEELLNTLTHEELYDFTVRIIKNNPDLTNAVFLEFSERIENKSGNKYVSIIRGELAGIEFDDNDYYSEEDICIDALDEWIEKAEQYLKEKKPHEAVLIAQAYIEEFASWLRENANDDFTDCISEDYQARPFEILKKAAAAPQVNVKDLYDYCMSELSKKKYAGLHMADCFNDLLMPLSMEVNPEAFIKLQQSLLEKAEDKSSYGAEKILNRIIDFYRKRHDPKTAWKYVEENIQIESFRRMVIEKRIKQKKFPEAKKLIHDYTGKKENKYRSDFWDDYLLQIARGEKDVPAIQSISYSFIKDSFREKYYRIYKSAFGANEWPERFENILQHYEAQKSLWDDPAADLLAAEGMAERLMEYIGKKLSLEKMEKYHSFFAGAFPEKTLALFRKAVDHYAENNTGRTYYKHIVDVFGTMKKIPGGASVVADMKARYLITYKNRRAMGEILNRS
ncbi:MAG: hypothetical protein LBK83_07430 [Treponema sp.]|jgi:hypothetical protein|nr:hypothetical protein [Treponema sp.]